MQSSLIPKSTFLMGHHCLKLKLLWFRCHSQNLNPEVVDLKLLAVAWANDYLSKWPVRQALPKFVDMREPAADEAWKQTLTELQVRV